LHDVLAAEQEIDFLKPLGKAFELGAKEGLHGVFMGRWAAKGLPKSSKSQNGGSASAAWQRLHGSGNVKQSEAPIFAALLPALGASWALWRCLACFFADCLQFIGLLFLWQALLCPTSDFAFAKSAQMRCALAARLAPLFGLNVFGLAFTQCISICVCVCFA
jgi:hypothetical protein